MAAGIVVLMFGTATLTTTMEYTVVAVALEASAYGILHVF